MSPEEVAEYLGIDVEYVKAYEAGEKAIPSTHAKAMANCMNISPEEVMNLIHRMD